MEIWSCRKWKYLKYLKLYVLTVRFVFFYCKCISVICFHSHKLYWSTPGPHGHMVIDAGECKLQLTWDLVQLWGEGEVIVQSACCQCYDDTSFSLCQSFTLSLSLSLFCHTLTNTRTRKHTLRSTHSTQRSSTAKSLWACWCVQRSWVQVPV